MKTKIKKNNKKLPENCPCCYSTANFTDKIKKEGIEYTTDAWFCNICGGLIFWK